MVQEFDIMVEKPKGVLRLVSQSGAVDLRVAYETGVINGDLENVEGSFNGIDDPSSIMGRPDDVFSVMRASAALKAVGAPAPSQSPSET